MYEIFTTGHCSHCRGNIISGTGTVREDGALKRPIFRRKPGCGFDVFGITCIIILHFNMCLY